MEQENLAAKYALFLPHLDERQKRLYLATEAQALGKIGVPLVAKAAGCSTATIYRGIADIAQGEVMRPSTRRAGGGRKQLRTLDITLMTDLEKLVAPATRGDPESPLRWVSKSTEKLAQALKGMGHEVSADTVGRRLEDLGYSLQANAKTREGSDHIDRDAQFQHINQVVLAQQAAGNPVISVDCKKKELVGNFKNPGQEREKKKEPLETNVHDFPGELGKAIPYGIYDVNRNEGFVSVGCDHETSSFAVESIRRWWHTMGKKIYPEAKDILICCDGGGSNGHRRRQWKTELARLAKEEELTIHVCHLPPGTSKWNKIEHRMFSHISMNWRGRPLTSHEVILQLIGSTTTSKGLKITSSLDSDRYPCKIKISDAEMEALAILRDEFHPEWNYALLPHPA